MVSNSAGFTIVLKCAQGHVGQGVPSSCQNLFTMDFSLCGAILNLKAFGFGAIPDIMIELIVYGSVPQSRQS